MRYRHNFMFGRPALRATPPFHQINALPASNHTSYPHCPAYLLTSLRAHVRIRPILLFDINNVLSLESFEFHSDPVFFSIVLSSCRVARPPSVGAPSERHDKHSSYAYVSSVLEAHRYKSVLSLIVVKEQGRSRGPMVHQTKQPRRR